MLGWGVSCLMVHFHYCMYRPRRFIIKKGTHNNFVMLFVGNNNMDKPPKLFTSSPFTDFTHTQPSGQQHNGVYMSSYALFYAIAHRPTNLPAASLCTSSSHSNSLLVTYSSPPSCDINTRMHSSSSILTNDLMMDDGCKVENHSIPSSLLHSVYYSIHSITLARVFFFEGGLRYCPFLFLWKCFYICMHVCVWY